MSDASNSGDGRLDRLLALLAHDAANPGLVFETAEAALSADRPQLARELLERHASAAPLEERALNLLGLTALALKDYPAAADAFEILLRLHPQEVSLRFNRAWALAMTKAFQDALSLLDETTVEALPQAAMLDVQLRHELADFDEAYARAKHYAAIHPDHTGLMAAISVLAVDMEDLDLARACAEKAGAHPDAQTTLGALMLGEGRDAEARQHFETALSRNAQSPRAWVGKGLVDMTSGNLADAATHLRHGAQLFDTHIGSWIAAGWACLLGKDLAGARQCFERALEIDQTFAETQGSLGVLAVYEGNIAEAERLTEIALRLDRQSFSAALAKSMLLEAQGKPDIAKRIIERALTTPIDATGTTVARVIAMRAMLA